MAYECEKLGLDYLVISDQRNPLSNTSSLSNAHCRIPKAHELEEVVRLSRDKFGDDENLIRFVYSNVHKVPELFKELNLIIEERTFGILPKCFKKKGGYVMLKELQSRIKSLSASTLLVDLYKESDSFNVLLRKYNDFFQIKSNKVVFATGGFGGQFKHNDCFRYRRYNTFDIIRENGGEIKNEDCIFVHPFGYNNGRLIFTGIESSKGDFFDENGQLFFDENTRKLIHNNDYHERMRELAELIEDASKSGKKISHIHEKKVTRIVPTVHYTAGGASTDIYGSVIGCEGMYSIGECRADGSKNGGRLPGHAFTSAIVHANVLANRFAGKFLFNFLSSTNNL